MATVDGLCLPTIDVELCTGCGDCVGSCHVGALAVVDGKATLGSPSLCDYCSLCEGICPQGAILCPFEIVLRPAPSGERRARRISR